MPEKTDPVRGTGGGGLFDHLSRLIGNFLQHLQALGALAGLEGREAAQRGLRALIALGAVLFFLAFGYILLILFLAFLLATVVGLGWLWIVLIFSVLHFALAGGFALAFRKQFSAPLFPSTAAELRKDFELLNGGRQ
ncbi:MAG: phage holin family protein [Chthoniobacterales bacterium]